MKKILSAFVAILFILTSCSKIDNWKEPSSTFHGTVYDSYTQKPLLSSQGEWSIRIWEKSWTGNPDGTGATNYQSLPIKQDGTYKNTMLFDGTYDMIFYNGPFWVVDTIKDVVLKGSKEQHITVTPYLQVVDFHHELGTHNFGTDATPNVKPSLTITCKLKAPIKEKNGVSLPNLRYVQAFLSRTFFCGAGTNGYINIAEYTTGAANDGSKGRIDLNRTWAAEMTRQGLPTDSEISDTYTIGPLPVNSGYTYNIRVGASCNVGGNCFNYSPIEQIKVP
jgi:hypothetical protein